jgi:uncharacterized membrane protein
MKRSTLFNLLLIGASFVIAAVAYPVLPDPTPIHWDLHGEADSFVAKPLGPFVFPLLLIPIAALFTTVRGRAGRTLRIATLAALVAIHAGVTLYTVGYPISINAFALVSVGLLLIVTGNLLGKVRRNGVLGVRTPWTLADDEVWLRSNRFGGRLMLLAGAILVLGGLLGAAWWLLPAVVAPMALAPVVHSYLIRSPRTR